MQKISGQEISQNLIERLKKRKLPDKILAAILVGEDPASLSFLRQKEKAAEELGVDFRLYKLSEELTSDDLRKEIGIISRQNRVGGVIIQLPLPPAVNKYYVSNAIPREKDVDVLGERALGAFYNGRNEVIPPAVGTVEEILKTADFGPKNKKVAVIGLGKLVGKPIATWLMGKCEEIYLLDRGGDFSILKNADLVVTGVGKPGLIKPEMLKEGAAIIDFGYYIDEDGKIKGDFDASELEIRNSKLSAEGGSASSVGGELGSHGGGKIENLNWYTPTPGGTGPILVAKLFENFFILNKSE